MSGKVFIANDTEWLRRGLEMPSVAFGDSMLPFLKPLSEIRIRPVTLDQIKRGDLVAFRLQGHLCVHRALKLIRRPEGMAWLTKGDNRFRYDPLLGPQEIVGVVVRVGSSDLTTRPRRLANHAAALLSYYPLAVSLRIISWLPRGKRLATRWAASFQPFLLLNRILSRWSGDKALAQRFHSRSCGVELRNYREEDADALVELWNCCLPTEPTDPARFIAKIRRSPWFSPEGCFLAFRGSRMAGFVFSSERLYPDEKPYPSRKGFVECLGVDPHERRKGIGSLLLSRAVGYLRSRGCHNFQTGRFRIPSRDGDAGVLLGPPLSFFGRHGFEIMSISQEFSGIPDQWDRAISERWRVRLWEHGMVVRTAEPGDLPRFENAIRQWGHPNRSGYPQARLLAVHEDRVVGYCHAPLLEEIRSYDQIDWVWAATSAEGFGYIHGLYVDRAYRRFGLGAALVALACDNLFDRGCREVRGWAVSWGIQARYLRWNATPVHSVVTMSRSIWRKE